MQIKVKHVSSKNKIPVRQESITHRTGKTSKADKSLFEKHDDFFNNLFTNL